MVRYFTFDRSVHDQKLTTGNDWLGNSDLRPDPKWEMDNSVPFSYLFVDCPNDENAAIVK